MRLSFVTILAPGCLVALLSAVAIGCGGCSDSYVDCDADGENCQICDGYGCNPADPQPGATSGNTGAGGSSTTGGQGGSGGDPCDPAVTTCACADDDECTAAGTQCIGGLCIPGCEFSYQCGAGEVCANGACVPECDADTPCGAGYTCDKGICVVDPENPECGPATDCTGGEICVGGFCTTPCSANADCPAGEICDASSGACIDDPSPVPGCDQTTACTGVGQVCKDDGYCHYPCADVNECKLIDARFDHCHESICKTDEEVNPECTVANPCPAGQDCISNECI